MRLHNTKHVVFEESFLLGWVVRPTKVLLFVEVLLSPRHPAYAASEQEHEVGCYKLAVLSVQGVTSTHGIEGLRPPVRTEVPDEFKDVDEINELAVHGGVLRLGGDEYAVVISGESVGLEILADESPNAFTGFLNRDSDTGALDWNDAEKLLGILGAGEHDPRMQAVWRVFGLQPDDVYEGAGYLESEEKGLSVMFRRGKVDCLFFHGEGKDGFAEFSGPLIEGLSFSSTAQEVRAILGAPRLERFEGVAGTAKMEQFIIEGNMLASFDYRADGRLWMLTIQARSPSDA